jgi:hypothetical protein
MSSNPFATRFTAPGKLPYLAEPGFCARLHEAWLKHGRVGAIQGPHGCGKSTLLATLEQDWSRTQGYRVTHVALHDGQRALPDSWWQQDCREQDLLVIDGYEQLGWRARWGLQRLRRRTSCGLLVTTHQAPRLPVLLHVEPDYPVFLAVVRRLLETTNDSPHGEEFLTRHAPAAWQATGGNAREALFWLYDRWEKATAVEVFSGGTR